MPPRRRAAVPNPIDVDELRRKLADGKIVRVGLSRSAQFPEGGTGRVRQIGDPAVDGDEYIQVEVSLNGTRDVLPFTPADLTPATRTRTPSSPPAVIRSAVSTAEKAIAPAPPVADETPHQEPLTTASGTPGLFNPSSSRSEPAVAPGAASKTRMARGPRKSPAVSITIATAETDPTHWRIEAKVGAKVVVRAGSVSGARVWELVGLLEDETLTRAVGAILEEQRKATQARADALASELARVRAELEELPGRS